MRATAAEGHVLVWVSSDIELVRVFKDAIVAVSRCKPRNNLLPLLDQNAVEVNVFGCGSSEVIDRARVTQELLNRPWNQVWSLLQQRQLIWVVDQVVHGVGDCVASGFVSGNNQQQEVGVKVTLAEFDAIRHWAVHQNRNEVGAVFAFALTRELVTVCKNF